MYNELYDTWKRELESTGLTTLPPDFYLKMIDYLKHIKEEGRMLDKRTVKTALLKDEMRNVKRMLRELILTRYRKATKLTAKGEKIPLEALTSEEEKIYSEISTLSESLRGFIRDILRGYLPKAGIEQKRKRAVLRFLKDIPAIIGADMKTYGPFKSEDVASLPIDNAKILVRQGLAGNVEA